MKLKLWMAVSIAVIAIGMAVASVTLSGNRGTVRVGQPAEEDDFETRFAAAETASVAAPPAGAVAPAPPTPHSGGQRPAPGVPNQGNTALASSATSPLGTIEHNSSTVARGQAVVAPRQSGAAPVAMPTAVGVTDTGTSNNPPDDSEAAQFISKSDTAGLWAEATRLKGATTKSEIRKRISINKELFNRLWGTRRAAEQQSKAARDRNEYDSAQAVVASTTKQINDLEAAINTDSARLSAA